MPVIPTATIACDALNVSCLPFAEITASTQAEFGRLVGEQLSSGSTDMFEAMQKMFTGMPIADQNALGAMQTAMDTTRAAFEQMTRASTQAFQAFTQQGGKGRR